MIFIISISVCVLVLIFLTYQNINARIKRAEVDMSWIKEDLANFRYDYSKKYISFHQPVKIFKNARRLSLENFLSYIISENKNDIAFLFHKSKSTLNNHYKFKVKIKAEKSAFDYVLTINKSPRNNNFLLCSLSLIMDTEINKEKEMFKQPENKNEDTYSNFIFSINKRWNSFTRANITKYGYWAFYYVKVDGTDLLRKYYSPEIFPRIRKAVMNLLAKELKKNGIYTNNGDTEFIIFRDNISGIEKCEFEANNIAYILEKKLNIGNVNFNLTFKIGIFMINNIDNMLSYNDSMQFAKIAANKAIQLNRVCHIYSENDKSFNEIEHNKELYVANLLKKYKPSLVLEDIFLTSMNEKIGSLCLVNLIVKNKTKDIKIYNEFMIQYFFHRDNPKGLAQIFNENFKKNTKQYFIIVSTKYFEKNIFFWFKFQKYLKHKVIILLTDYYYKDIDSLASITNQLVSNNIETGLWGFEFFHNNVNFVSRTNINYIFLKRKVIDKMVSKEWPGVSLSSLSNFADKKNIKIIATDVQTMEELILISKVNIKHYQGDVSEKIMNHEYKDNEKNSLSHYIN